MLAAPHFQPVLGESKNPGQMLQDHPGLPPGQTPFCRNFPFDWRKLPCPMSTYNKLGSSWLKRQAHSLHGSLCVSAITKDTSPQPSPLSSDVIDSIQDWGPGSFSQADHANIIKPPGFNFQPLPNCLLRHVESQAHSFFPPFPGDWSSLMIVL